MQLGIIADDFTGATDVAGFLVAAGVRTTQLVGVPADDRHFEAEGASQAIVISLKSRSCPPEQAVRHSCAALAWLQRHGAHRIYQKYCSTFDSTTDGNIGPVADALMDRLEADVTVVCPALPVNGRTIYHGYLFVNGVLLEETGMRHHPITPMTDSHLGRLMEAQSRGRAGVVPADVVDAGATAVRREIDTLAGAGIRYVVLDALRSEHLDTLARAVRDLPLTTGGSGLAAALARACVDDRIDPVEAAAAGRPDAGPAVILSGSCSDMTRAQVRHYAEAAPAVAMDVDRCLDAPAYARELAGWVQDHQSSRHAPLVYATTDPGTLQEIQRRMGPDAGEAVERTFASLARLLADAGTTRFIVAGGETSGAVVDALGVDGFHVGPQIAPGVPWVRSIDGSYSMALKSGNFGSERFFFDCQRDVP
ncbi:MAG: 3-oxo-tetronate kinase [Rhodothermales bacterium]